MPPGPGERQVAEGAMTALHTEMVLYFVSAHLQRERLNHQQQVEAIDGDSAANTGHGTNPAAAGRIVPTPLPSIMITLEAMGFNAGARLIERHLMAEPRLLHMTPTDAMKYVAGPFWKALFGKKVDRLKGSHYSFNMWDLSFKWTKPHTFARPQFNENSSVARTIEYAPGSQASLTRESSTNSLASSVAGTTLAGGGGSSRTPLDSSKSGSNAKQRAAVDADTTETGAPRDYLFFITGAIRGALDSLGFSRTQVGTAPQVAVTPAQVEFRISFARDTK